MQRIGSLNEAIAFFRETLAAHPERDALAAHRAALAGKRRRYPVLGLNHLGDPEDKDGPVDDLVLSEVVQDGSPEMGLAAEILPMLEYEFIRRDLERYPDNPRLLFGYTGMHWRKKDRPMIRDLHRRLDAYWEDNVLDRPL